MFIVISLSYLTLCLLAASNDLNEIFANNETVIQKSLAQDDGDSSFHVPGDKWTTEAIKDIAYYLRHHKFNEWDHRYYEEKPNKKILGFFTAFPQLCSLHWEVKANCRKDFYDCIGYLYSIVKTAPYSRTEVIATIYTSIRNETQIKRLYQECTEIQTYANKIGLPFDDLEEKFQWTVTASYYMCWYTMLGVPSLSMIGENCDNFANCFATYYGNHNHDPRADDNLSFKCAMYSFCPDPCCPMKHLESIDECYNDKRNPCFLENSIEQSSRVCHMDRKDNQIFEDIISNKWDISCNCREGFVWISKFGMCVDVNECLLGTHECDVISQDCLNVPGRFLCICKWEFESNANSSLCLRRNEIFN